VHQPTSAAEERSIAIKQADPVVIFTWRLLNEAIRADSARPWVTLDKACGCAPDIPCRHFQDARLGHRCLSPVGVRLENNVKTNMSHYQ
jgi:hypothetical protein